MICNGKATEGMTVKEVITVHNSEAGDAVHAVQP